MGDAAWHAADLALIGRWPAWAARLVAVGVLLISAGFAVVELAPVVSKFGGIAAFNDFFAHWSFARFVRVSEPVTIYQPATLHRFQLELDPTLRLSFPFPYPPPYLFLVWPFGALPFVPAQLAWDAAGMAMFTVAAAAPRFRPGDVAVALLAPATILSLAYGQNGLIEGALLLGGLRLMAGRPALGGMLLGLAAMKPGLGLLIPVALLAARAWRTIAAAMLTAGTLALLAAWAFGPQMWPAWFDYATQHAAWLQGEVSDYRKPTVMATLSLLGADPAAAQAGQITVAILVAAVVAACCRRGIDERAGAVILSGTFLAVPFAFTYDLPVVAGAVLMMIRGHRGRWTMVELGVVALAILFPALTTLTSRFFYMNPVALASLFGLASWQCLRRFETMPEATQG